MIPKEKGYELVKKYFNEFVKYYKIDTHIKPKTISIFEENEAFSKQCALIAVDEILEMDLPILELDADSFYDYWEEVKQQIEKL